MFDWAVIGAGPGALPQWEELITTKEVAQRKSHWIDPLPGWVICRKEMEPGPK